MIAHRAAATLMAIQISAATAFVSPTPTPPTPPHPEQGRVVQADVQLLRQAQLGPLSTQFGLTVPLDQPGEDSPDWSCVDDGNRVCGPGNPEGKPAACYDDGGVIAAYWPCSPWTPDTDPDEEVYRRGYTN